MTAPALTPDLFEYAQRLGFRDMSHKDMSELQEACHLVYAFMKDGAWHTATAVIEASGQREGLRRLRELAGVGFVVEKRRLPGRREWEYRIVDPEI